MTGLPRVRAMPLEEIPAACPGLRFAVRFADGRHLGNDAGAPHPLAGAGALWLACAVDRLAGRHPDLLREPLAVSAEHRSAARTGTTRLMSGPVGLIVQDALGLVLGAGDGACVLAILELLEVRGLDVLGEARALAAELGLRDTEFTAAEATGTELDEAGREARLADGGAGLLGTTTSADLCVLLTGLSDRVLGWMQWSVEPAGLAGGLPGFGPRTVPHHATGPDPSADPGHTAVLVLPGTGATSGTGGGAVVAGHLPARHPGGALRTPLEVSAVLGTLGLAVHQDGLDRADGGR